MKNVILIQGLFKTKIIKYLQSEQILTMFDDRLGKQVDRQTGRKIKSQN